MGRLYQREKLYDLKKPEETSGYFKLPTLEGIKSAGTSFMAAGEQMISEAGGLLEAKGKMDKVRTSETPRGLIDKVTDPFDVRGKQLKNPYIKRLNEIVGAKEEYLGKAIKETYGDTAEWFRKKPSYKPELQNFRDENGNIDPKKFADINRILNVGATGLASWVPSITAGLVSAPATVISGILMEKGNSYAEYSKEIADKKGINVKDLSVEDIQKADETSTYYGLTAGSLESLTPLKFIEGIGGKKAAQGILKRVFMKAPLEALKSIALEGGTEGLQQFAQNILGKMSGIKPDQRLAENVIDSVIGGAIVGGPLGFVEGMSQGELSPEVQKKETKLEEESISGMKTQYENGGIPMVENGELSPKIVKGRISDISAKLDLQIEPGAGEKFRNAMEGRTFSSYEQFSKAAEAQIKGSLGKNIEKADLQMLFQREGQEEAPFKNDEFKGAVSAVQNIAPEMVSKIPGALNTVFTKEDLAGMNEQEAAIMGTVLNEARKIPGVDLEVIKQNIDALRDTGIKIPTMPEDTLKRSEMPAKTEPIRFEQPVQKMLPTENISKFKTAEDFANQNPFKESKVKQVVYHGFPNDFKQFDMKYLGNNGFSEGKGFYFTDSKEIAEGYKKGDKGTLYETYLDIKNPMTLTQREITDDQLHQVLDKIISIDPEALANYGGDINYDGKEAVIQQTMDILRTNDTDVDLIADLGNAGILDNQQVNDIFREITGYDGIISKWKGGQKIYVAFSPDQIITKKQLSDEYNKTAKPKESVKEKKIEKKVEKKPVEKKAIREGRPEKVSVKEYERGGKPVQAHKRGKPTYEEMESSYGSKNFQNRVNRERGVETIKDTIKAELKRGSIDLKTSQQLERFINRFPKQFEEVALLMNESGDYKGAYEFGKSIINLFRNEMVQEGKVKHTTVHEFWHHLTKYIPKEYVDIVNKEYQKERKAFMKKNPDFARKVARAEGNPKIKMMLFREKGEGSYKFYDVDEWFAEKMTAMTKEKMEQDFEAMSPFKQFLVKIGRFLYAAISTFEEKLGVKNTEKLFNNFWKGKYDVKNAKLLRGLDYNIAMENAFGKRQSMSIKEGKINEIYKWELTEQQKKEVLKPFEINTRVSLKGNLRVQQIFESTWRRLYGQEAPQLLIDVFNKKERDIYQKGTQMSFAEGKKFQRGKDEKLRQELREKNAAKVKEVRSTLRKMFKEKEVKIDDIKGKVVDYAKANLPEAKRGIYLNAVKKTRTLKGLARVIDSIDAKRNAYERSILAKQITKVAENIENLPVDIQRTIIAITSQIELKKHTKRLLNRLRSTQEYLDKKASDFGMPRNVLNELGILKRTPFNELTTQKLIEINNKLQQYNTIGKNIVKNRLAVQRKSLNDSMAELEKGSKNLDVINPDQKLNPFDEKNIKWTKKMKERLLNADLSLLGIDRLLNRADGRKDYQGANFKVFKKPVDAKWNEWKAKENKITMGFFSMLNNLKMTKENAERIAIYAYKMQRVGTEKLMEGRKLTAEQIESIKLNKKELAVYNFMRKNLDSLHEELADYMAKEHNVILGKPENYFPMMTDYGVSKPLLEELQQLGRMKSVAFGNIKERQENARQVLQLDAFQIFASYVGKSTYYMTMDPTIRQLNALASSDRYARAVGQRMQATVLTWLDVLARKGGPIKEEIPWLRTVNTFNNNLSVAVLGLRITSIAKQPLALLDGAAEIGSYVFVGVPKAVDPKWTEFMNVNSSEIRERFEDPAYEEIAHDKYLTKTKHYAMFPLQYLDIMTAKAVWAGAYTKKMDQLGKEVDLENPNETAARYADLVVRKTQASAAFKDSPTVLTGRNRQVAKLVFKFQMFVLNRWSYIREDLPDKMKHNKYEASRQITFLALSMLAEQGITSLYYSLRSGGDDDKENKLWKMIKGVASSVIQTVPYVGQSFSALNYKTNPVPIVETMNKFYDSMSQVGSAKKMSTKTKHALRVLAIGIGTSLGIPTMQADQLLETLLFPSASDKKQNILP